MKDYNKKLKSTDWICPHCETINEGVKEKCKKCKSTRLPAKWREKLNGFRKQE